MLAATKIAQGDFGATSPRDFPPAFVKHCQVGSAGIASLASGMKVEVEGLAVSPGRCRRRRMSLPARASGLVLLASLVCGCATSRFEAAAGADRRVPMAHAGFSVVPEP